MITSLDISGFRSFKELHVDRLTRVNLFVGRNSAGKTSILEALEMLVSGDPASVVTSAIRRGERTDEDELDLSQVFHRGTFKAGLTLEIRGDDAPAPWIRCEVVEDPQGEFKDFKDFTFHPLSLFLKIQSHRTGKATAYHAISSSGGSIPSISAKRGAPDLNTAYFLGTEAEEIRRLSQLWDNVVLTPEENQVAEALKIIDPRIERVALLGEGGKQKVVVRLANSDQRVALGTLGDGLKRVFQLALHLVSASRGVLLVDEIDTGLHYTVMADMWRLVIETARRLDIQVFATTHSQDCVRALAWVRDSNPELADDVTLHRVEKNNPRTVPYSLDELATAARHHVEVR